MSVTTLNSELHNITLKFVCSNCRSSFEMKGSSVIPQSAIKCPSCGDKKKMSYVDKVRLFNSQQVAAGGRGTQ